MISAYHRAKLSAIKIMGKRIQINQQNQNMNNNHLNDNGAIVEGSSPVNFTMAKEQETIPSNNLKNICDKQSQSHVELVEMNTSVSNDNITTTTNTPTSSIKHVTIIGSEQSISAPIIVCTESRLC